MKSEWQRQDIQSNSNVNRNYDQTNFQSMGIQEIDPYQQNGNTTVSLGNSVTIGFVVVTKDEIEAPWREECDYLQKVIQALQNSNGNDKREQELYQENQLLKNQLKTTDFETNRLSQQTSDYQLTNGRLMQEIEELKNQNYRQQQEQSNSESTETTSYLTNEISIWKEKFISLNHNFNDAQEQLTMCQAELESLRQQREMTESHTHTSKTVRSAHQSSSGQPPRSENVKGSQSRIY